MEIYINENRVDYKLNNEKSLFDVVSFLKTWVNTQGGFIKDILVDGKNIDDIHNVDIKDVKRMDVFVSTAIKEVEETIPVLKDYINRFLENIEKPSFVNDKNEKIEGILWIIDAITLTVKSLKLDNSYIFYKGKTLEEVLNFLSISLKAIIENIHNDNFFRSYFIEGIKPKLIDLLTYVDRIVDFYNYVVGKDNIFIKDIISEIDFVKNSITDLSIMINEGKDKDVLLSLQRLLKFFEFLTLCFSLKGENISSINNEIVRSFNNIYEYFKEKDYVSVIDIIEYEIGEKLDIMKEKISGLS